MIFKRQFISFFLFINESKKRIIIYIRFKKDKLKGYFKKLNHKQIIDHINNDNLEELENLEITKSENNNQFN